MLRSRPIFAIFVTLLFAGLGYFLGTNETNRPIDFSPEEIRLAEQVLSETDNFEHPSLIRRGVEMAALVVGEPETVEETVLLGRRVSAVFMTLAIAGLVLLASCLRSYLAPIFVGVFACLHWALYEQSHLFSPDSALLFGLVLVFLSMVIYDALPSGGSALLMGICVGIAASGKYFGFFSLLLVLPAYWGPRRRDRGKIGLRFWVTLAGALITFILLHLGFFWNFGGFWEGIFGAFGRLWGARENALGVPNLSGLANAWLAVSWNLIFFVVWWFVRSAMHESPRRPWEHVISGVPFLMMLLLTVSRDGAWSHFLPGTLCLVFLAGVGGAWVCENSWHRIARPISLPMVLLFIAIGVGGSVWSFLGSFKKFHAPVAAAEPSIVEENRTEQ